MKTPQFYHPYFRHTEEEEGVKFLVPTRTELTKRMTPPTNPLHDPTDPVPDSPLDVALLLTALRRTIVVWRERAVAATEREARIYRQAEADLTTVISKHPEMHSVWTAARHDLVRSIVDALDERDGRHR